MRQTFLHEGEDLVGEIVVNRFSVEENLTVNYLDLVAGKGGERLLDRNKLFECLVILGFQGFDCLPPTRMTGVDGVGFPFKANREGVFGEDECRCFHRLRADYGWVWTRVKAFSSSSRYFCTIFGPLISYQSTALKISYLLKILSISFFRS